MSEFDYMNHSGEENEGVTYHGPANGDGDFHAAAPTQGGYSNSYSGGDFGGNNYTPPVQPPQNKRAKKNGSGMTAGRVVALGLCCAIVGGIAGGGGVLAASKLTGSSSNTTASNTNVTSIVESARTSALENVSYDTTGEEMTAAEIYAANVNSTVGITVSITYNVWGYTTSAAASGSGFILTEDGYIVTNYHVVEDADSDGITVTMYDGTTYDAVLVGYDADNDVAVLKIEASGLTPVVLGDSDTLSVGDDVIAIGNPLGELTFSLTSGAVSALNRAVTVSTDSSGNSITMNLIQTDAAINSGNSGGALFNSYGEVVGITNAKYSSSSSSEASIDNIGFAIPINSVKTIIESIIENGYVEKPYMGITMQTYSYTTVDGQTVSGAMIYTVESGSAAEAAGLQRGDLITTIDGTAITSSSDASSTVAKYAAGDTITVTIDRNGQSMDVSVTLGSRIVSYTNDNSSDSSSSTLPYGYGSNGNSGNSYGFGSNNGNGSTYGYGYAG